MKDGPIRSAVKYVARQLYAFSMWRYRRQLARAGELVWDLEGECNGCGVCCENPGIGVGPFTWFVPPIKAAFIAWQRIVNGFVLTHEKPGSRGLYFRCTHFDPTTRKCDSYDSRPGMCRDYPVVLLHSAAPRFRDECSYRPVLKSRSRFLNILDEESNLTPEQREKLKDALRLR